MKTLLVAALLATTAVACKKAETTKSAPATEAKHEANVPTATIDEVDQALAKGDCTPVDANGDATRKKLGTLPGAVLLSDSETFNVSELPADKSKPLVFYCANTHCGASHEAAGRAITAGYQNVKVMPEGIAGWVKAGKKTQSI